jgi:hypothetical protein
MVNCTKAETCEETHTIRFLQVARLKVLMSVRVNITAFWDVTYLV